MQPPGLLVSKSYRTNSADNFYLIGKRVDISASGLGSDLNEPMTTLTGNSYGDEIMLLMRVTDAGAETTSFHSRVQLSLNGGNSWFYDTETDPDLPNGWRLNAAARHIMWDVAPGAGPITYDDFSVKLDPPASNANTGSVFRVMTYNIHSARGVDGKVNTQRIANFILAQDVDLVGLNEVNRYMDRAAGRDLIGELARETVEDLGAGIFDRDGNNLAESDSTPMFMGAMPKIVKNVIRILGDDMHDGDVILHNDPYAGATHSPDVAIVIPVFHEGKLVGFSGASAHVLDIGGAYPGLAIDLVDNWSEGNIYRAVKLQDKGVWQAGLWKHILENVRTPSFNNGDIQAMIAACELARTRYTELLGRYGEETVLGVARAWLEYSEKMLRQEIAKVPDGRYETEVGWLDDDGRTRGVKLPVKVAVVIEGDEITFDLTGSSDEVPTGYNCPFEGTTVSAMTFITRMIFLDEATYPVFVPQNEGMLAPVNVIAPKGSIFNPNYPRACFARFCQVQRAVDLALRALAPVIPDKITAGNSAHLGFLAYSGFNEEEGEYWVYLEVDEGSYGGRPGRDGLDSVDCLIANTRNNPIEELEWRFPMRTERYELRDDPCAAGRWRGGIGMVRVNRFLVDTIVSCEGDRYESDPPWGIFGGHGGTLAYGKVTRPDGTVEFWPAKFTGMTLPAGSTIELAVPNSGGYGDPLERDPAAVLSDVLDGFTTIELAGSDYGVVLDPDTLLLDPKATAQLRAERSRPAITA